ncbi:MAG: transposase [Microcoleaceae cyanobacterium]
MITLTYQYKLKPSKQQEIEINHILDVCKSLYNYALRERKDWLNSRKSQINSCSIIAEYIILADAAYPNYNHQAKNLTIAKKTYPRLKSVNAQVLQQTLKTLDRAFSDMKSQGKGFPRFKKKLRSFVFPAMLKNCLGNSRVKLPQLGWIKIRQSRPYPDGFQVKQARILKKATGYYLMVIFQSSELVPDNLAGKKSLGVDAGIESFVATSTGKLIKSPKFLLSQLRELKLASDPAPPPGASGQTPRRLQAQAVRPRVGDRRKGMLTKRGNARACCQEDLRRKKSVQIIG